MDSFLKSTDLATMKATLRLEVRPATIEDAETLACLAAAVFREAYRAAFESDRQVEEYFASNFTLSVVRAELSGVLFRDAVMTRQVKLAPTCDTYSVGYCGSLVRSGCVED